MPQLEGINQKLQKSKDNNKNIFNGQSLNQSRTQLKSSTQNLISTGNFGPQEIEQLQNTQETKKQMWKKMD